MKAELIQVGLKFTSSTFSAEGEISRISEVDNAIDVKLVPSDGQAWEEKGWNLKDVSRRFETGEYKKVEPNNINIAVW